MSGRPRRDSRPPRRYEDNELTKPDPPSKAKSPVPLCCPCSPSPSNLSVSRDVSTPITSFTDDSRSSSRVKSPTYRTDLYHNNIEFERGQTPQEVLEYARNIVQRARTSPGLQDPEGAVQKLSGLEDVDEEIIRDGYVSAQLLPEPKQYPGKVSMGSNIPLDPWALPHTPMAPPLAMTKPDKHYCLDTTAFTAEEDAKQSSNMLRRYAKPSTAGAWPYFTVEFKSESRGGTLWVAANQNATSGALCVNSLEQLIAYTKLERRDINSIAFSCNLSARDAEIWIHYCSKQKFFSYELERFHMTRSRDVIQLRNYIKNIVEFGVEERLPQIKKILAQIALPDLRNMDKSRRGRRCSTPDIESVEAADGKRNMSDFHRQKRHAKGSSTTAEDTSPKPCTIPTEVTATIEILEEEVGRSFELNGQSIFVPERDWKKAKSSGRSALINLTYNVWFVDD